MSTYSQSAVWSSCLELCGLLLSNLKVKRAAMMNLNLQSCYSACAYVWSDGESLQAIRIAGS